MGSTPRERLTQIPLPTRSSEASAECVGSVFLSYLREDEQKPASYFILGTALHEQIEDVILYDVDEADALDDLNRRISHELDQIEDWNDVLTTTKRDLSTIFEDGERMLTNWFRFVHPDSEDRLYQYEEYHWPPKVEQKFHRPASSTRTKYPVWGSIDSLFDKPKKHNDPPMIIDWKSGTRRPNDPFQLDYYRFGAELTEARAAYHMLDRVRKDSILVVSPQYAGDEAVRSAVLLTEQRKDNVLAAQMPPFTPSILCGYCPVQHICPEAGPYQDRKMNLTKLGELLSLAEPLRELPEGSDLSSRD